jgi:hypothetical protein
VFIREVLATRPRIAEALSGRLHALANAHPIVQRQVRAIDKETSFDIGGLITVIVKVHERTYRSLC